MLQFYRERMVLPTDPEQETTFESSNAEAYLSALTPEQLTNLPKAIRKRKVAVRKQVKKRKASSAA